MKKYFGIILCCCLCGIMCISCKNKDDATKDLSGYTFKMDKVTIVFHSKEAGKDNSYNVTVTTDYGSTDTAERSAAHAYWDWTKDKQAGFQFQFEIGNKAKHVFQQEDYKLVLNFDTESTGTATGKNSYTRVWRNWSSSQYNVATDVLFGTENIDAKFTLTK